VYHSSQRIDQAIALLESYFDHFKAEWRRYKDGQLANAASMIANAMNQSASLSSSLSSSSSSSSSMSALSPLDALMASMKVSKRIASELI
jgi:hypothetical protein